jgi:hypothetical protein
MIKLTETKIETTSNELISIYRLLQTDENGNYDDSEFKAHMTEIALSKYPDCYIHDFIVHDTIIGNMPF